MPDEETTGLRDFFNDCPKRHLGGVDWDALYEEQFAARWRGRLPGRA